MPTVHKDNGTIRAFIAIELPENIKSTLRQMQNRLKEYNLRISWTRPENIHLTLKFLGDTRNEIFDSVCKIMSDTAGTCSPIELYSQSVGVFPSVKRPRVLWTGISGQTEELARLQKALDIGLSDLGFAEESRSFTGHLTLGRPKNTGSPEVFIDILKVFQNMKTDVFVADSLNLYKSKLLPSGPIYSKLFSAPLGAKL